MADYFKRFGTIAIEKEFITKDQLYSAIVKQVADDLEGKERRRIGSILYSLGHINSRQIDEIVNFMEYEDGSVH